MLGMLAMCGAYYIVYVESPSRIRGLVIIMRCICCSTTKLGSLHRAIQQSSKLVQTLLRKHFDCTY